MQELRHTYTKKLSVVYLKFKLNWHLVFYQGALNPEFVCVCGREWVLGELGRGVVQCNFILLCKCWGEMHS